MNGQRRATPGIVMIVFGALALAVLYAAWLILLPFLTAILLALVIVTFTHPYYVRLTDRLKGRSSLAAALMLIGITFVLVLPAWILTVMLINEATGLFELMQKTDVPAIVQKLELSRRLTPLETLLPGFRASSFQPEVFLVGLVRRVPAFVAAHGGQVLAGFANVLIGFLMMLLAAYYFYIEGAKLTGEIKYLSPLPDEYDREILEKFKSVVDATFRGQMLTALAQGVVTAIGLAITGVPAAILWGAVAALCSLIPMVGAAAVWVPATIYLFAAHYVADVALWRGVVLALWGVLVVSLVDNVVRPWAMKEGTRMPAVVLFFAILGGLQAFGFVGLVLGPLVFALLVTVVDIYKDFFRRTLEGQNRSAADRKDENVSPEVAEAKQQSI